MKVDYIRKEVSSAISEDGGAYIQLVNKNTVGLADSINEAIKNLYINGQATTVKSYFEGLFRSMLAGIQADGHPRQLGGLITVYPVATGTFDLDTGWDPLVNSVRIYARLLNEVDIDVTNWSLNDVTPGKVSFTLESVAGPTQGVATRTKAVDLNGKNFPAQSELRVTVSCNGKEFDVPSTKIGSSVTRITLASSALDSLTAADNGKEITFTVRGCYNKATIKGVFVYAATIIAHTTDNKLQVTGIQDGTTASTDTFNIANNWLLTGTGFYKDSSSAPSGEWYPQEVSANIGGVFYTFQVVEVASDNTSVKIKANDVETPPAAGTYNNITLTYQVTTGSGDPEMLSIPLAAVVVA